MIKVNGVSTKEILEAAIKIADENPDYVYNDSDSRCLYTAAAGDLPGSKPEGGCIVGRALIATNAFAFDELVSYDAGYRTPNDTPNIIAVLVSETSSIDEVFEDPYAIALSDIQAMQDAGLSWRDAALEVRAVLTTS